MGTTSSNAIDPVREIARICRDHNLWLHVDSAMSGTAALCPEFRFIHDGVEFADSYTFNPHKWMFTNFDCNVFYVADRKHLIQTLSILPEYLRNQATESGAVIDYRDWHIQLGRRFRSLKLWFVIRHYGIEGLQHHIREHVRLAQQFVAWVRDDSRFELAAPAQLNLVCFRLRAGDQANQLLMDRLNGSGDLYLTHTKLDGKLTLRFCVGQTNTQARHVERAWQRIQQETGKLGEFLELDGVGVDDARGDGQREISAGGVVLREISGVWHVALIEPQKESPEDLPPSLQRRRASAAVPCWLSPRDWWIRAKNRRLPPSAKCWKKPASWPNRSPNLSDNKYVYVRTWGDGKRVFKIVSFYLMRYVSGEIDNLAPEMRIEVKRALWVPLADAAKQLAYSNERKVLRQAQEYLETNPTVETGLAPSCLDAAGDAASRVSTGNAGAAPDRWPSFLLLSTVALRLSSDRPVRAARSTLAPDARLEPPTLRADAEFAGSCLRPA